MVMPAGRGEWDSWGRRHLYNCHGVGRNFMYRKVRPVSGNGREHLQLGFFTKLLVMSPQNPREPAAGIMTRIIAMHKAES